MGFKLTINFSDGSSTEADEIFETEEDAMNEYQDWLDNWAEGAEVLEFAGEDFSDADIVDCCIEEI